jgi:sulfatase modifying factor 1
VPPSCLGNKTPVCTSYEVPGGAFDRSYDGVTYTDAGAPAVVSGFRLDAYEVTVARFSNFVTAVVLGTGLPEAGAGKHVHLNGEKGLVAVGGDADGGDAGPASAADVSYETGWDPAWNANLATTEAAWDANLTSFVSSTWYPPNQGANADLPINAVTWYEAYAFCIWDGGFLPSEAEWNYAASGGGEQRVYPWGTTDPGTASEFAIYGCYYAGGSPGNCSFTYNIAPVGSAPMGDGKFGQSDLAGNMWEWTLDGYAPYVTPCQDCAALGGNPRVFRGGTYYQVAQYLAASSRQSGAAATRFAGVGFRCARTP